MREVDLARSFPIVALVALRSIPLLLGGRARAVPGLTIDGLVESGFVILKEEPGAEIVLGIVGKFWKPTGGIHEIDPAEFRQFNEPGFAKVAWNFRVQERGDGSSLVVTETRIACTDGVARRKFLRYWRLIGPFSALIRRLMLQLIRRNAERMGHS